MPVTVCPSVEALSPAWSALLDAAGETNFFYGRDWFAAYADTLLEDGMQSRLYGVEADDGKPMMMMAMKSPSSGAGSVLRGNFKREGSLAALANYETCEYGVALAEDAVLESALLELARYMWNESPAWSFVEVHSIDRESPLFVALVRAFRRAGFIVGTRFHFGNWYDRFEVSSYDEYLTTRDAKSRKAFKNYARKGRKLEREGKVEFQLFTEFINIDRAIDDYKLIYQQSWKGQEQHPDFLPRVLKAAARLGRLRMGLLYFEDLPIAAEVGVLAGNRATMLKTVYDKRYRTYSVGALVMMRVLEHLVNVDRIHEIDFGRDDQDYKKLWVPRRRERWGVVAFNPWKWAGLSWMPSFFGASLADHVADWARPWAKPALERIRQKV